MMSAPECRGARFGGLRTRYLTLGICYMHPPGLAREICAMATAWSNQRLVKPTIAHVAMPTNLYFANEKLHHRTQDAVMSVRHRGPRPLARGFFLM